MLTCCRRKRSVQQLLPHPALRCRAGAWRPAPLTRSRGLLQAGRAACEASCKCCARCGAGELQASSSCLEKRQCSAPDAREASVGCEAAGVHKGLSLP